MYISTLSFKKPQETMLLGSYIVAGSCSLCLPTGATHLDYSGF